MLSALSTILGGSSRTAPATAPATAPGSQPSGSAAAAVQRLRDAEARRAAHRAAREQRWAAEDASDGVTGMTNSTLRQLNADAMALVLSFLSFRERCRTVRPVCGALADACDGDALWVQLCHARGFTGRITEASSEPEPDLYLPSLRGAGLGSQEACLPVQVAAIGWALRGSCSHRSEAAIRRMIEQFLAPQQRAIATHRATLGTCRCGAAAALQCVECGFIGCTRTKSGCMAHHRCGDPDSDGKQPTSSAAALPRSVPPDDGYCYGCSRDWTGRNMRTRNRASRAAMSAAEAEAAGDADDGQLMPPELLRQFAPRDLHESETHAGLFMRNECPHLDAELLQRFQRIFETQGQRLVDTNCVLGRYHPAGRIRTDSGDEVRGVALFHSAAQVCNQRSTYVCLQCGVVLCGVEAGGHMHDHSVATQHPVVLGVRSLTLHCFACDRTLGFGGSDRDARAAAFVRAVVLRRQIIYHHRPGVCVWSLLDPPGITDFASLEAELLESVTAANRQYVPRFPKRD